MKKNLVIVLLIFLVPLAIYCGLTRDKSLATLPSVALSGPEIIKFSSPMCYECQELDKIFDEIYPEYANKVSLRKIDVTKKDKAGYMPEVENITLKLVADRRSHRILGAQAIGCGDADKKVNTISVGLARRITVEDLLDVDLTYAPPFSTSVDILHSAARMLKAKIS